VIHSELLQYEIEFFQNSATIFEISAEFWLIAGYMGQNKSIYLLTNQNFAEISKIVAEFYFTLWN
jgi:hypothetical protein